MRKLSFFVTGCIATVALLGFSVPAYALVDPDCDGEPHNNTPALHDVSVTNTVGDSNVEHAVAGLEGHGLACGTDISDNYVGVDTQYVRTDIETPLGVGVNDATGMTDGRYVGTANVNVASFLGGAAGVIEDVPAVLRIDQDSGTDCPVEALACFRGDTEHFLLEGHAWIWLTEDSGRYTLTIGEFYNDLSGEPSGLTHINSFVVCGYAGTVEGRECGNDPQSWLMTNGDQSTVPSPDCSNGNGIFTITATMRNGTTVDPVDVCVPWVPEETDPACDAHNNQFATHDFDMDTPDTHRDHGFSSLTGELLACGTAINSSGTTYEDNGSGSQFVRFDIEAPPGVWARGFGTGADTYFTDFYAGNADVNLITWSGSPTSSTVFQPNTQMELRVDTSTTNDCPVDATTCYRMQTTGGGVSAHGSVYVTEDSGIYTWTIGELHNDSTSSPVGISKVNSILFCRSVNYPDQRGCDNGTGRIPQRNGDISAPDCNGGAGPEGIYTLTGTNRDGQVTAPSETCVAWYKSISKCKRAGRKCKKKLRRPHRW